MNGCPALWVARDIHHMVTSRDPANHVYQKQRNLQRHYKAQAQPEWWSVNPFPSTPSSCLTLCATHPPCYCIPHITSKPTLLYAHYQLVMPPNRQTSSPFIPGGRRFHLMVPYSANPGRPTRLGFPWLARNTSFQRITTRYVRSPSPIGGSG